MECPYKDLETKVVYKGKWASMKTVKFKLKKNNEEGMWESAYRNDGANKRVDGVDIIATLISKANNTKHFVFVKQFRIPINGFSLEFPAGLLEPNETVEKCGLRELKEETGYVADRAITVTKGFQYLDPGLSNDSVNFIRVDIDGDRHENVNPVQALDEGEDCQVVLIPCDKVLEELDRLTKEGLHVEAMVYTFAMGYAMNQ